jgi:hypothetical protein
MGSDHRNVLWTIHEGSPLMRFLLEEDEQAQKYQAVSDHPLLVGAGYGYLYLYTERWAQDDSVMKSIGARYWDDREMRWVFDFSPATYERIMLTFDNQITGYVDEFGYEKVRMIGSVPPEDFLAKLYRHAWELSVDESTYAGYSRSDHGPHSSDSRVTELTELIRKQSGDIDHLHAQIASLREIASEALSNSSDNTIDIVALSVESAAGQSGDPETFVELIRHMGRDATAIVIARRVVEQALSRKLLAVIQVEMPRRSSLHEIISQVREYGLLSEIGIEMVHNVRKHGNIIAHQGVETRILLAQYFIVVWSMSTLWPEIKEFVDVPKLSDYV